MFNNIMLLAQVASLLTLSAAHMILQQPVPWGVDTIDNSPLDNAFPGNYPCKQRQGVYALPSSGYNKFPVGSTQTVSFKGSATHGGGSCQLSVTTDLHPTATSVFKVIYSVIGSCPLHPLHFTVPLGLPNGKYTLAWTWYNKIGNRELYMNCAPIEVSNGTDSLDAFNKLPDMYTVNLPNTGCESEDSKDLVFPHPGAHATTLAKNALATAGPSNRGGCAKQTLIGAGNGKATLPAGAAAGAPASTSAASAGGAASGSPTAVTVTAQPNTFVTSVRSATGAGTGGGAAAAAQQSVYQLPTSLPAAGASTPSLSPSSTPAAMSGSSANSSAVTSAASSAASSGASPAASSSATRPAPMIPSYTASAGASLPSANASNAPYPTAGGGSIGGSGSAAPSGGMGGSYGASSGSGGSTGVCKEEGAMMCSAGGKKFGLCNHGKVVWQSVASGTKCVGGEIV